MQLNIYFLIRCKFVSLLWYSIFQNYDVIVLLIWITCGILCDDLPLFKYFFKEELWFYVSPTLKSERLCLQWNKLCTYSRWHCCILIYCCFRRVGQKWFFLILLITHHKVQSILKHPSSKTCGDVSLWKCDQESSVISHPHNMRFWGNLNASKNALKNLLMLRWANP